MMVKQTPQLSKSIDKIHEITRFVKSRLRNSAALRNLTDLRPNFHNHTRWSGKYNMLARYADIKEDLAATCEHEDDVTSSLYDPLFSKKASFYMKILKIINTVTDEFQKERLTLRECQRILGCCRERES